MARIHDNGLAEIGPIQEGGPMERPLAFHARLGQQFCDAGDPPASTDATILATSSSSAAQDLMARSKLRVPPNARRIRCFRRPGREACREEGRRLEINLNFRKPPRLSN